MGGTIAADAGLAPPSTSAPIRSGAPATARVRRTDNRRADIDIPFRSFGSTDHEQLGRAPDGLLQLVLRSDCAVYPIKSRDHPFRGVAREPLRWGETNGGIVAGTVEIPPGRSPSIDDRIFSAALESFAAAEPLAVSVESVAATSGVAKTTIYRRYENRESLLTAAISAAATSVDYPADLSAQASIRWVLRHARDTIEQVVGRGTVAAVIVNEDPHFTQLLLGMIRADLARSAKTCGDRAGRARSRPTSTSNSRSASCWAWSSRRSSAAGQPMTPGSNPCSRCCGRLLRPSYCGSTLRGVRRSLRRLRREDLAGLKFAPGRRAEQAAMTATPSAEMSSFEPRRVLDARRRGGARSCRRCRRTPAGSRS